MKMIYLTFNISELEDVQKLLTENKIEQYQVFDTVCANTAGSIPRMNTPIWPGYNAVIMVQINEASADKLTGIIKYFNEQADNPNERITLCLWQLDSFMQ